MIYLHKILPVFLLPTGLAMLLIASGLFLRRRVLCWIGIGLLWFCSTPIVSTILMRAVPEKHVERWNARTLERFDCSLDTPCCTQG